jgi:hypothetical protein
MNRKKWRKPLKDVGTNRERSGCEQVAGEERPNIREWHAECTNAIYNGPTTVKSDFQRQMHRRAVIFRQFVLYRLHRHFGEHGILEQMGYSRMCSVIPEQEIIPE